MMFLLRLSHRSDMLLAASLTACLVAAAGCSSDEIPTNPSLTLDVLVLTPSTVTLEFGETQQFAVYGLLSNGDSVDVPATFTATGGTITSSGLYTAGQTAGDYDVIASVSEGGSSLADTATAQIVPHPPTPGAVADPTLLPLAAPNQLPDPTAYDALGVPSQSSGFSYADPVTGTTVHKISDANTPVANTSVVHDYAEFGPHISMPWIDAGTGHTMYTLHVVKSPGGEGYFVDFDYETGNVSGWRPAPWDLLEGGFSSNPATPRVGYRISDNQFYRVNTATGQDENTGNFPSSALSNFESGTQLLIDGNDEWFVAQGCLSCAPNDHGAAWNAVTGQVWDWGNNAPDEFRIDRGGDWVFLNFDTPTWHQGSLASGPPTTNITTWLSDFANSHGAGAMGYLVGIDPTTSGGPRVFYYDPATHTRTWIGDAGQLGGDHLAAQWVNDNLPGLEQWVLTSAYNADPSALLYEGIGFFQLNDASASKVRLLAHHYSAADKNEYFSQPHATMSPDGKIVMWGSEMNVPAGRIDIFLARVPSQ